MTWNIYYYLKSRDQEDQVFTIDRSGISNDVLNSYVEDQINQSLSYVKAYKDKKPIFDHKNKTVILSENN